MAIDEALLEQVAVPSIRFYQWHSPALSFGYFGKFTDVANYAGERDLVRRWTGGGIVFHGDDLTYSIIIPLSDPAFAQSSISIYEKIHLALVKALTEIGQYAVVAGVGDPGPRSAPVTRAGIADAGYSNCFANPVHADVMLDGRKIAGAAQRRMRQGLLQQGSIQQIDFEDGLPERFSRELSNNCEPRNLPEAVHYRARELAERKYGTTAWLRKR
jgi:lipoate-protein ligase A